MCLVMCLVGAGDLLKADVLLNSICMHNTAVNAPLDVLYISCGLIYHLCFLKLQSYQPNKIQLW